MQPINSRTERVLVVIPVAAILLTYSVLPAVQDTGITGLTGFHNHESIMVVS